MPNDLEDEYIRMLLQSRIQMIDPYMMPDDVINDVLEACYPLYQHLKQREIANAASQKL